ncbi:hypothetical protein FACS1894218_2840 [Bacilli bacterium]|nr:hypothetical protein FACS1894218_2840 [Bacilli bacterium]
MAVVIFRDPLEDGSELIIVSKPINRMKLIAVKIICYLVHSVAILLVAMITMAFMYCFGDKSATNTSGIDFAMVPKMGGGLFIGGFIVILFFGGIAIIVNGVFNKVGILIITIGIGILMLIISTVAPLITTTPADYVSKKYGTDMESSRYVDLDGNYHNDVYSENSYYDDDGQIHGTVEYADKGLENTNTAIASYVDIGRQMSGVFDTFTSNRQFDDTANAFGSDYTYRYTLNDSDSILKHNGQYNFDPDTNKFLPNIDMRIDTSDYKSVVRYNVLGPGTNELLIYSFAGIKDDTVALYFNPKVSPLASLSSLHFYSGEEMYDIPDEYNTEVNEFIGTYAGRYDNIESPIDSPKTMFQQMFQCYPYGMVREADPISAMRDVGRFFRSIILYDLLQNDKSPIYNGRSLGFTIGVDQPPST